MAKVTIMDYNFTFRLMSFLFTKYLLLNLPDLINLEDLTKILKLKTLIWYFTLALI